MDEAGIIGATLGMLIIFAIVTTIYFLPTIIALSCRRKHQLSIFLLNLLMGWTVLGWVASLVWSTMDIPQTEK